MKTLRILSLEDSAPDAELIHANLTEGGIACEMFRAQTRADFLSALEKESFDLILSDYSLPSFDGLSALKIAQEIRPEVPFILVSGALGEERAIEALKNGATDYVLKQRLERLVPAVHRAMRETGERIERKQAEEALRRSEERYRVVVEQAAENIFVVDFETRRILEANTASHRTLGYSAEELRKLRLYDIVAHDRESVDRNIRRISAGKGAFLGERKYRRKDGSLVDTEVNVSVISYDGREALCVIAHDVTERKRAEEELRTRARQQSAVADLGRRALADTDLSAAMDEAAALVARALNVEYSEVLELLPDGDALLLRAGTGWKEGLVGNATVGAGLDSQAGYTLLSEEPVIVEDLRTESRFDGSSLLHEHGVVSGTSVLIQGRDGPPFGVLGAHTRSRRTFTEDDVNFLRAVANVLCEAIGRREAKKRLGEIKESERRRIAAELHDEVLQDMVYGLQEAQIAQLAARGEGQDSAPDPEESLETIADALQRSVEGLRAAIFELHLEEILERSIVLSIESLVELNRRMSRKLYEVHLNVEGGLPESSPTETGRSLVRIVQEALSNARRHSGARNVRVTLKMDGDDLCAEVADDGRGFEVESTRSGIGTSVMRRRALDLGGEFEIESEPGFGTVVRFRGPTVHLLGG